MKVELKGRMIPHRKDGYPNFTKLGVVFDESLREYTTNTDLLNVFSPEEIVELVNRCVYQLEYQRDSHKKYQQRQRDFEAPIKEKLKELYPGVSWAKATPEQLEHALNEAYKTDKEAK